MVYLRTLINENRDRILQFRNLEAAAYLSITNISELEDFEFHLTPEEKLALKGFKGEQCEPAELKSIVNQPIKKGMSVLTNVYKLSGLYLCNNELLKAKLKSRYDSGNIRLKYFLTKVEPALSDNLKRDVETAPPSSISNVIKRIFGVGDISEEEINADLLSLASSDIDTQTLLILEDLEKVLLKVAYLNLNAEEMVRSILNNFSNAVQKVIKERRKGHDNFEINDEYDVQDILYVILKSVFPNLKEEESTPKIGGTSSRVDFVLREEAIMIEAKMIKSTDDNEKKFIDQLKVDFESYHEASFLKKLFCFVYDPFKKTRDIANFQDLNGDRTKGKNSFNIEVIVVS